MSPHSYSDFLQKQYDIFFAIQSTITPQVEIKQDRLYDCHIYLVVNPDDPLSQLKIADYKDLEGRTLLVGGGSPIELQQVQRTAIQQANLTAMTSANHETTLINIASNRAVCLIPGLLNDFTKEFIWVPFNCKETMPCVLCSHKDNHKETLPKFIEILKTLYASDSYYTKI